MTACPMSPRTVTTYLPVQRCQNTWAGSHSKWRDGSGPWTRGKRASWPGLLLGQLRHEVRPRTPSGKHNPLTKYFHTGAGFLQRLIKVLVVNPVEIQRPWGLEIQVGSEPKATQGLVVRWNKALNASSRASHGQHPSQCTGWEAAFSDIEQLKTRAAKWRPKIIVQGDGRMMSANTGWSWWQFNKHVYCF